MQKDVPEYDEFRKNRASSRAALRVVIALYLAYLGWKVASGAFAGDVSIPPWAGLLVGGSFVVIAALFGIYTWKRYRADLKDAESRPEELAEGREED